MNPEGVGELVDFMPVRHPESNKPHIPKVVRQVKCVRGKAKFRLVCLPAVNYAREKHSLHLELGNMTCTFVADSVRLGLSWGRHVGDVSIDKNTQALVMVFTLAAQESVTFMFRQLGASEVCSSMSQADSELSFQTTAKYWQHWLSKSKYKGRWREPVHRSALVLKLLTYEPTGAIIAAPTTSLPEHVGGERNWDYRYVWIRDAAFTIYGLIRIGFVEEAERFMEWLQTRAKSNDVTSPGGPLNIMYDLDGNPEVKEFVLPHLNGYMGSRPVRVGNAAHDQLQLDIYGELMDAVYLCDKYGTPISYDFWLYLIPILNWVCDNWRTPDHGIWEPRSGKQHLVYSKLMCWVALDRAMRLGDKRSLPYPREKWLTERNAIYTEIHAKGYNTKLQSFVQGFGLEGLDAATLIMPLVLFISPTDPRYLSTLDRILLPPEKGGLVSDSLVYRYNPTISDDGLRGGEGTFNMCTFWLVEALTRSGRKDPHRLQHARLTFERMLGYANHLGLFSEETGPCGEALGNYPQALTHLSLISSAFNLERVLENPSH